ncbi:MAG: ABC transporter permease [Phycisphaeraceae bacterium]|nr:ABC transporter permease [Phycisphaeraceae bacterium]MCW5754761.1 ABC transporter permease [Phycisphaeraceae bacterium]
MTILFETIRLGLKNLALNGLRSVLTALGIILGVAAVIAMVSIGEGKKQAALSQIERLGARNIILRSQRPPETTQQQGGQGSSFVVKYGLTREDVEVIRENLPDAEAIVPVKEMGNQVLRADRRQTSQAFGTTPELQELAKLRISRGRYLTHADLEERAQVAVLGSEVARQLFAQDDPLGAEIRVDDKAFTVVGILMPVGLSGGAGGALIGRDLNLDVHVPITTARVIYGDLVVRRESGSIQAREVQVSELYIASPSRDRVLPDAARIRRVMEQRHPGLTDVGIIVPYELLETAKREALTMTLVTAFIAGIALLVGGIGIMNIMLASVTERTREIGIRRAIGATRKHVVWQFLVETGVLSALGGLVGVVLGITVSLVLEPAVSWAQTHTFLEKYLTDKVDLPTQLTAWSITTSFTVAVLTGLVFGIYPAMRAAAQDPIVALRHD